MHNLISPNASDENLEVVIKAKGLTAPRVTLDDVNAAFSRVEFITEQRPGGTTSTFVHAFLDGKFHLGTGSSACVSAENFNAEIGQRIAKGKAEQIARDKLWELMGFALYEQLRQMPKVEYTWGDVTHIQLQEDLASDSVEFVVSMRDGQVYRGNVEEGSNEVMRVAILKFCNKQREA